MNKEDLEEMKFLLSDDGNTVHILNKGEVEHRQGFNGSFAMYPDQEITDMPAAEFEKEYKYLPDPMSKETADMIEARRVGGGSEEIYIGAFRDFKKVMTQEGLLKIIADNPDVVRSLTEVFEKVPVPVMPIAELHTEEELGKLDNADYTAAYKAGKWTSLQKNGEDMYPIGGSENWPSIDEIRANPTNEFYMDKGSDGQEVVMHKKPDNPKMLDLSNQKVMELLGGKVDMVVQPSNWGEGSQKVGNNGACLCMNGDEVYIVNKDNTGLPESYQKIDLKALMQRGKESKHAKSKGNNRNAAKDLIRD